MSGVCTGCTVGGSCNYLPDARVYKGGKEKKCNPRGCPGQCNDDTKICYTDYPCTKASAPWLFHVCTGMVIPTCQSVAPVPMLCYPCIYDVANRVEHWVDNDACG